MKNYYIQVIFSLIVILIAFPLGTFLASLCEEELKSKKSKKYLEYLNYFFVIVCVFLFFIFKKIEIILTMIYFSIIIKMNIKKSKK